MKVCVITGPGTGWPDPLSGDAVLARENVAGPNTKHQRNPNLQTPIGNRRQSVPAREERTRDGFMSDGGSRPTMANARFGILDLELFWCLVFGIWCFLARL